MSHTQFKLLVFVFMILIVFNLFRGLYFLVTGKEGGRGTARALSWRIGLSMLLFLILMALKLTGIVEPHDLNQAPPVADDNKTPDKKDQGKTLQEIQQQDDNSGGRIRLKQ